MLAIDSSGNKSDGKTGAPCGACREFIEESRIDREEIEKIALLKEISVRMVIHGRVNGG